MSSSDSVATQLRMLAGSVINMSAVITCTWHPITDPAHTHTHTHTHTHSHNCSTFSHSTSTSLSTQIQVENESSKYY